VSRGVKVGGKQLQVSERCGVVDAQIWYFERTLFLHPPAVVSLDALHYRHGELLPDRRGCVGQARIRRLHVNICALSP
jgi:hypothetical protein